MAGCSIFWGLMPVLGALLLSCCTGATLLSFVVALVHFITEVLIFKTMSIKGAATPMAIAGITGNRNSSSQRQQQQQRFVCLGACQAISYGGHFG